jgi:phosphoribosylglycinamide formyltransferase-1
VKRLAVFASGGGSNFQALLDHRERGDLHVEFALMIGNNSGAGAFERARRAGVPAVHLAPTRFADENSYADRLMALLGEHRVDLIALAGYMRKLPLVVVRTYRDRILNIHPALLPAFGGKGMYGTHVHEAVLAAGAKLTGVTVHLVNEEYDQGAIVAQEPVRVLDDDTPQTLAERVLAMEHATYWRAVEACAQGRIHVEGNRVRGDV